VQENQRDKLDMSEIKDIDTLIKFRKILTEPTSSILSPSNSKTSVLTNTYLRMSFIAKVIDYLAHYSIYAKMEKIGGDIIIEAVCNTPKQLSLIPSNLQLLCLLHEMSEVGLGLLDSHDLGEKEMEVSILKDDKLIIKKQLVHQGFSYSLSVSGWEAYKTQKYQIILAEMLSARIGRVVSYSAILLSIIAIIVALLK